MPPRDLLQRLEHAGQSHLLRFYDDLTPEGRTRLVEQVRALDLEALPALVEQYVRNKPAFALPPDVEPAPYYPSDPASPVRPWNAARARATGDDLFRRGKVAAFTVAGGQGSRLGFEGPKGCYPAGAVTGKTLFTIFAEGIRAAERKYGRPMPWYIMTSPLNHADTVAYFEGNGWLGLRRENLMFFPQGVMPSLDIRTGRVLMASTGEIASNPDGHGGSLRALHASGALADMRRRSIEHISYFQVDNPIVKFIDPVFLGLHAGEGSSGEMSSKMIQKAFPEEKLGLFCRSGGRVQVIEYSDLPMDLQRERLPDGRLRFNAGSLAVHILSVAFVERLNTDKAFALPWHRAEKKIPCIDPDTGAPINPQEPNGVKLERFVFDALPMCRASVVYETDRVEEFAPIKNATGMDSVESSHQRQTERAARWLERAGVKVPRKPDGTPDCVLEISPLTALEPDDLRSARLPNSVARAARVSL